MFHDPGLRLPRFEIAVLCASSPLEIADERDTCHPVHAIAVTDGFLKRLTAPLYDGHRIARRRTSARRRIPTRCLMTDRAA